MSEMDSHLLSAFCFLSFFLSSTISLPMMRMRLCVASNNPYRLQNQCVYCHNKKFQQTVRICSGAPYLPANVSLEEGYCMVRQCRSQMPLMRPEPFYAADNYGDAVGVNVDALSSNDDMSYARPPPPPADSYGFNSLNSVYPTKPPQRMRPPAPVYVGRPLRPGNLLLQNLNLQRQQLMSRLVRPFFFGKRSIDESTGHQQLIPKLIDSDQLITMITTIQEEDHSSGSLFG